MYHADIDLVKKNNYCNINKLLMILHFDFGTHSAGETARTLAPHLSSTDLPSGHASTVASHLEVAMRSAASSWMPTSSVSCFNWS